MQGSGIIILINMIDAVGNVWRVSNKIEFMLLEVKLNNTLI